MASASAAPVKQRITNASRYRNYINSLANEKPAQFQGFVPYTSDASALVFEPTSYRKQDGKQASWINFGKPKQRDLYIVAPASTILYRVAPFEEKSGKTPNYDFYKQQTSGIKELDVCFQTEDEQLMKFIEDVDAMCVNYILANPELFPDVYSKVKNLPAAVIPDFLRGSFSGSMMKNKMSKPKDGSDPKPIPTHFRAKLTYSYDAGEFDAVAFDEVTEAVASLKQERDRLHNATVSNMLLRFGGFWSVPATGMFGINWKIMGGGFKFSSGGSFADVNVSFNDFRRAFPVAAGKAAAAAAAAAPPIQTEADLAADGLLVHDDVIAAPARAVTAPTTVVDDDDEAEEAEEEEDEEAEEDAEEEAEEEEDDGAAAAKAAAEAAAAAKAAAEAEAAAKAAAAAPKKKTVVKAKAAKAAV